ncbi:MAG: ABC transporter ATP-binding protein [Patescibacteria group bacterium]
MPTLLPVVFENTNLPDVIELRNICQTYDGGKAWVLQYVNLLIEDIPDQGQFVVILGPSGCGKSTLLKYIAGLQKPTSGEVLISGKVRTDDVVVGMVFQQYSSLPWFTVLENVMLGLRFQNVPEKEAREKAMQMLEVVGLACEANKFAKSTQLSGGQMQRVAIARSLISNPGIILMDEPFGALDINTRHQMQLLLCDIWEKLQSTIIFVTHDINEAVFLADDIYVMTKNPGYICKHWIIDLPKHRDRSTKRDPRFIELANEIDDYMQNLRIK